MVRIIVADDHPVFRQGLVSALEKYAEFQVIGDAASGAEVLAKVSQLRPDLVIMDIFMCASDGVETTKLVRQRFPEVKVLILTMSGDEGDLFRAIKAGASGYLVKTVGLTELVESIRLVATGNAIVSPSMTLKLLAGFREATEEANLQESYSLTSREIEILRLAAKGATNKEIAAQCFISETTVKTHVRNILQKLNARNRAGALAKARARGLVKDEAKAGRAWHVMAAHRRGVKLSAGHRIGCGVALSAGAFQFLFVAV